MSTDPRIAIVIKFIDWIGAPESGNDVGEMARHLLEELDSHARAEHGGDDVERVARALAEESHRQLMRALESKDEHWEEDYRELARAALSAIPRDERDEKAHGLAAELVYHLTAPRSPGENEVALKKARALVALLSGEGGGK